MWRWQPMRLPKRFRFWSKLLLFSAALHAIVILWLFVLYQEPLSILAVDIKSDMLHNKADIVLLPLKKRVHSTASLTKRTCASGASQPKTEAKQLMPVPQKKVAVSNKGATPMPKRKTQDLITTKTAVAPSEKAMAEKSTAQVGVSPEQHERPPEAQSNAMLATTQGKPGESVVYVGQHDLDALELFGAVQEALQPHWRPPVGLAPDTACVVSVRVGWDGSAQEVTIVEKSGIIVCDTAARKAVLAANYPRSTYGKQLVITLRP